MRLTKNQYVAFLFFFSAVAMAAGAGWERYFPGNPDTVFAEMLRADSAGACVALFWDSYRPLALGGLFLFFCGFCTFCAPMTVILSACTFFRLGCAFSRISLLPLSVARLTAISLSLDCVGVIVGALLSYEMWINLRDAYLCGRIARSNGFYYRLAFRFFCAEGVITLSRCLLTLILRLF